MKNHITPEKVPSLTAVELRDLIGKYVVVEMAASEWYKEHVGGEWEGGSGVCSDAGIQNRTAEVDGKDIGIQVGYVMWEHGFGWSWTMDAVVHIHVCDEHGAHGKRDEGAAECLRTLGVRGREPARGEGRKEASVGEAEEAEATSGNADR